MTQAPQEMHKEIHRLALPNILSNISVPLLSTVDIALMGYISTAHIAAIGIASMLFNFIYWNMGFVRISSTAMIANAFGAKDEKTSAQAFYQNASLILLLSFLILIFQSPIFEFSSLLFGIESTTQSLELNYYKTRILAAPAALLLMVVFGSFFGLQNTKSPLLITIVINVINISLNYYTVKHLNMGIKGVALSTVIAQYTGLFIALLLLFKQYPKYLKFKYFKLKFQDLSELFSLNQNIFLRTLALSLSFVLIYRFSNDASTQILAINTILLQLINWMSFAIDGFAHAAESLVGKYRGANNTHKIKQTIRLCFLYSFGFALFISLAYFFAQEPILQLFTSDKSLIHQINPFYVWMVIIPILATASYVYDGIFVGFKAARAMRDSMLGAFLLFVIALFSLAPVLGNHGIWISFSVFLLGRAGFQHYLFSGVFSGYLK